MEEEESKSCSLETLEQRLDMLKLGEERVKFDRLLVTNKTSRV